MKYFKLERNLIDILKEQQVKLGYRSEAVRLYYPIQSLNRFFGTAHDIGGMKEELNGFVTSVKERLGEIEISNNGERFCFLLPAKASDYVHEHMDGDEFIRDFVNTVSKHGVTVEEVLEEFYKHSARVHVEKASHGEFDYLVYFEDGKPDEYRYCITDEGCHIIYHRYTKEDYEEFHFDGEEL